MIKNAFKETKEMYAFLYKSFNTIGRFTLFPLILLMSPIFFMVMMCFKWGNL
jgi:hypothetical protein